MRPDPAGALADKVEELKCKGVLERDGQARCFYTLWDNEEARIWEQVPHEDFIDSIVEGSGRQDWRKLRPFDLLPDFVQTEGSARKLLMVGDKLRVACEAISGTEAHFNRAGDFQTILFQFSGVAFVETSFSAYQIRPGEALLIPAMVAHRTTGSPDCRRMVFYAKDALEVRVDPDKPVTESGYVVHRVGQSEVSDTVPQPLIPQNGKVLERLVHWNSRPEELWLFKRTYEAMVGKAQTGSRPVKVKPFDYFHHATIGAEGGTCTHHITMGKSDIPPAGLF